MVINGNMKEKMNMYNFDADKVKNDCVQFIKDFFEEMEKIAMQLLAYQEERIPLS